jgi:hypothetical protein
MAKQKPKQTDLKKDLESAPAVVEGVRLFEYVEFLIRRKELFVIVFFCSLLFCYGLIYVFVDEQFESTALIVPREMELYNTIIFSRSMMERVITEFHLIAAYRLDTADRACGEKAVKRLREEIFTKEMDQSAFQITVRALSAQQSAAMTNFIVRSLNERIVDLKTSSSRENRIFLSNRIEEIYTHLHTAEDSLRLYEGRTGMVDTKGQMQEILTAHTILEAELTARQLQKGILGRMYDKAAPQVREVEIQILEFQKKLALMRSASDSRNPLLALERLPKAAVEYLRRFRDVEINNLLLQHVVPLYEQAKIEETKGYAILQVIDEAVPASKRSYPPRTLFAFIGAFSITLIVFLFLFFRNSLLSSPSPRWEFVVANIRHWKWK